MSLFLLSAVMTAAFFFLLLSLTPILVKKRWAAIAAPLLAVLLIAAYASRYYQVVDPTQRMMGGQFFDYFAFSYDFREVAFGALFGIVFAYWLKSIFHPEKESPDANYFREGVIGALLLMFLIVGLGNNSAVMGIISRITNVKVGGAEFTLASGGSAHDRGSQAALAAVYPPSAAGAEAASAPASLDLLVRLPSFIERDALYAALRGQPEIDGFLAPYEFNKKYIAPMISCLVRHASATGDDDEVSQWISVAGRSVRSLLLLHTKGQVINQHPNPKIAGVNPSLPHRVLDAMMEVGELTLGNDVTFGRSGAIAKNGHKGAEDACDIAAQTQEKLKSDPHARDIFIESIDNADRSKPYLWLFAADALAYQREYKAAILLLDNWLKALDFFKESESGRKKSFAQAEKNPKYFEGFRSSRQEILDAYAVRVRTQIATLIEEWTRRQPAARTQNVLDYHLANLEANIGLIEPMVADHLTKMQHSNERIGFKEEFNDYSSYCEIKDDKTWADFHIDSETLRKFGVADALKPKNMYLSLIYSLFTLKRTWIDAALQHDHYFSDYSARATRYADEMTRLNLSCLSQALSEGDPKFAATMRAQALNSYARVEAGNVAAMQNSPMMGSERESRLRKALMATDLGLRVLPSLPLARASDAGSSDFLARIEASEVTETRDLLVSAKKTCEQLLAN